MTLRKLFGSWSLPDFSNFIKVLALTADLQGSDEKKSHPIKSHGMQVDHLLIRGLFWSPDPLLGSCELLATGLFLRRVGDGARI